MVNHNKTESNINQVVQNGLIELQEQARHFYTSAIIGNKLIIAKIIIIMNEIACRHLYIH